MSKIREIIEEENDKIIKSHPELELTAEDLEELTEDFLEANSDDEMICDFRKKYKKELNDYLFGYQDATSFTNDALKDYLSQISKYPLLKIEEEIELAKRIEQGDEKAKQKLIESNLRLVIYVAKKFPKYSENPLDLIQAGNIGLINMINKYDYRKGKFSTYAIWWIRREISAQLSSIENNIQISNKTYSDIKHLKEAEIELKELLGRSPSIKELAKHLNITIDNVMDIKSAASMMVSLNSCVNEDGDKDLELQDTIPSECEDIEKSIISKDTIEELNDLINISNLTDLQKTLIYHNYGLFGYKKVSLAEIAKKTGKSRTWIGMQEKSALLKLRKNVKSSNLKRTL